MAIARSHSLFEKKKSVTKMKICYILRVEISVELADERWNYGGDLVTVANAFPVFFCPLPTPISFISQSQLEGSARSLYTLGCRGQCPCNKELVWEGVCVKKTWPNLPAREVG